MRFRERVAGCFQGLATGDAIGKQTETLARAEVRKWYPAGVTGLHGRPGDVIPRYVGKRYPWRIGETTDDTEQTIAVARALLQAGEARHDAIGRELLQCRKSVHPGVRIWEFQQSGDASGMAFEGDGCGAAMRAAPVGVVYRTSAMPVLVRAAYECAIPTHGGQLAICAAAAVAGAVSAALDGAHAGGVLMAAVEASRAAESLRPVTGPATMTACIAKIHAGLAVRGGLDVDEIAQRWFPDRPETIVPLAISLAVITGSAEETALIAANVGGDSDSVASIGGAVAGALCPDSVNQGWYQVVRSLEEDDLLEVATALAARWPRD
jgi:ADP-ribosylglycohydrolase